MILARWGSTALFFAATVALAQVNPTQVARLQKCATPLCFQQTAELEKLGYESAIAERIVVYRPDLFALIVSPEVVVAPSDFISAMKPGMALSDSKEKWFPSQVQDRSPITVYRGMLATPDGFDPSYLYKQGYPISDPRIFTSDKILTSTRYATRAGKPGILFKMQIPRFLLYVSPGGPYGMVYFRDLVPDDFTFVSEIAFIAPNASKEDTPNFVQLETAISRFKSFTIRPEERLTSDGKFLPTKAWADAICAETTKANFVNHFFNRKVFEEEASVSRFRTLLNPASEERALSAAARRRLATVLNRARDQLPKLVQKYQCPKWMEISEKDIARVDAQPLTERIETEVPFEWFSDVAYHCLKARSMVLGY